MGQTNGKGLEFGGRGFFKHDYQLMWQTMDEGDMGFRVYNLGSSDARLSISM